jgi:hypothetical protein
MRLLVMVFSLIAMVPFSALPPPIVAAPLSATASDWPQLGYDPQRTNASPLQVDGPYCYQWKWYEAPIASRAQPVVAAGRLFVGDMDGFLHARNATTGAQLWRSNVGSPIRHSPAVLDDLAIVSTHGGATLAFDVTTGNLRWSRITGPSATAPLIDPVSKRVFVASTNSQLSALQGSSGALLWTYNSGAPILTSPALSADRATVFFGDEGIAAVAVSASDGTLRWRTALQGQSLADRYPVVVGDTVFYRSQPLDFFHLLLHEGDDVLNQGGTLRPTITEDWAIVRPLIVQYLSQNPSKQTFFTLNATTGSSRGVAPVLYTYGNNDAAAPPVVRNNAAYLMYRPRRGIQTDGGSVHVTTDYDAELGRMNLTTLDITGLQQANYPSYNVEFRLTSDEPAILTMSGDLLLVDNWERLGGINVATNQLFQIGNVSNVWPECYAGSICGPAGPNPFFPLSGKPTDQAYPFPSPRVTEGGQRGGAVVANGMIYWRVIEGGLAGIAPRIGATCPAPLIYTAPTSTTRSAFARHGTPANTARPLSEYVTLDLTEPRADPPAALVNRLREEVRALVSAKGHLMPFYIERGFSDTIVWPPTVPLDKSGPARIGYNDHGSLYWHDPGELMYTLAMAYPYLDSTLQAEVRTYIAAAQERFPPLNDLPYGGPWLAQGTAREPYAVPFRSKLNNWPPVATPLSSLYGLWLWSKHTNDLGYARSHWADATALFNARRNNVRYYADIAGLIGYARLAKALGDTAAYNQGLAAAVQAMETGRAFPSFLERANQEYKDPRGIASGWSLPVFYGLTPELGLYLREQTNGAAVNQVLDRQSGNGLRWWYLTRVGVHAEEGETSYIAPSAGWSHFLARAYILGDDNTRLRGWLDRPWARGDLYSIQRLVATLQAPAPGTQRVLLPFTRQQ